MGRPSALPQKRAASSTSEVLQSIKTAHRREWCISMAPRGVPGYPATYFALAFSCAGYNTAMVAASGEPVHGSGLLVEGEPDTKVTRELAPLGRLRAAINLGNPVLAQRNSTTGELTGVSVDLARELGSRLRVPVELIAFDAAGKVFAALETDA